MYCVECMHIIQRIQDGRGEESRRTNVVCGTNDPRASRNPCAMCYLYCWILRHGDGVQQLDRFQSDMEVLNNVRRAVGGPRSGAAASLHSAQETRAVDGRAFGVSFREPRGCVG